MAASGSPRRAASGKAFSNLAGVHQRHLVRHAGHHGQVVRDQQQAHATLTLQCLQQFQDLRLHSHVQRRGGLIGHQVIGLRGQRHRDHHALLLAAAHLEGIAVQPALGLGDAHALQPLQRLLTRRVAAQRGVGFNGLDDLGTHAHHRVEAGTGLLEDHADAPTADAAHAQLWLRQYILTIHQDVTATDGTVVGQQPHQGQCRDALAAAGFTHQRKGLAALQRQAERINGAQQAGIGIQFNPQVLQLEHRGLGVRARACGHASAAAGGRRVGQMRRARRRQRGWRPAPAPP